jgi:hypothetical protein
MQPTKDKKLAFYYDTLFKQINNTLMKYSMVVISNFYVHFWLYIS